MTKIDWIKKCQHWKEIWPVFNEQKEKLEDDTAGINLYKFYQVLNQNLRDDSVVCWDSGSSLYCSNQSLRFNGKNQRSIGSLAQAEMGCGISLAAGVCLARNKKEVFCTIGDGSFNTNPQALAILKYHKLPIKIFILQNFGYLSIANSQKRFYNSRFIGTCSNDGIFFPKIEKIAAAYEIGYLKCDSIHNLDRVIKQAMEINEPVITEIICPKSQEISPGITAFKNKEGQMEQYDFSRMEPMMNELEYQEEMIKD